MDDADLARRITGAAPAIDAEAEAELCRRFAPRIRLYGRKHLRDRDLAEDLVQQVMVVTLERLRGARVRDPERIASFVLSTCRLTATDLRRTAARRAQLLEQYGEALVPACAAEPTHALDRDRLLRCLERLAERERSVILTSFFEMKDAEAIARELRLTPGHLRVVRHRAIGRLRTCMEAGAVP